MLPNNKTHKIIYGLLAFIIFEVLVIATLSIIFPLESARHKIILLIAFIVYNCFLALLFKYIYLYQTELYNLHIEHDKFRFIDSEIELFRKHRHDLKNHLLVMTELAQQEDIQALKTYTQNYSEKLDQSLIEIDTGVKELDILFYAKFEEARKRNINIHFTSHCLLHLNQMKVLDLISLFSNAIDNAIEALDYIQNSDDRILNIALDCDPLDYRFIITNTIKEAHNLDLNLLFTDGYTTKVNKKQDHGKGLVIMKNIISKYDGIIEVDLYNFKFFQLTIEIPKHRI